MKKLYHSKSKVIISSLLILLIAICINVCILKPKAMQVVKNNISIGALSEQVELQSEIYTIEEGCISKIRPKTTVRDLKNNLDEENINVYNRDESLLEDTELVGTGMKLVYKSREYKLAVLGDLNGDGKVSITDLTQMKLVSVGLREKLENEYAIAGDMNNDGKISITDLTRINLATVNLIDIIAPETFIPEAERIGNNITIQGSTSDENSGIDGYYFKIDNKEWVQNEDKTKTTYTFKNVTDKEHTVKMKVKDKYGNEKITKAIKIKGVEGIYVNLYTDGTLAFTATDKLIDGKTIQISYGNIDGEEYTDDNRAPWHNNREEITNIDIIDKIKPTSISDWFRESKNLELIKNIDNINTEDITDMSGMFAGCSSLTSLDLSNTNASNVTNMRAMFSNCRKLVDLNLENLDTSKVTNMGYMFKDCDSLTTLDVSTLNTENVTEMPAMFEGCESLVSLDLSTFDTSNLSFAIAMFYECSSLEELNLSNFNTSGLIYTTSMFAGCSSLTNLDLSSFDTSSINEMTNMFRNCESLTNLDLRNFNTSQVKYMNGMFEGCSSLTNLDLSGFDVSKVTTMNYMFSGCSSLINLDLSNSETTYLKNARYMFEGCTSLINLDLSNFNTVWVTDMISMFENCSSLTSLNLSSFDTRDLEHIDNIFNGCTNLIQISFGENWTVEVNLPTPVKEGHTSTGWYSDNTFTNKVVNTNENYMPTGNITIYAEFAPDIYVKLYTDGTLAFTATDKLIEGKTLQKSYGNIYGQEYTYSNRAPWFIDDIEDREDITTVDIIDKIIPTSTAYWFELGNLTAINNINNLNTKNVTDMSMMFTNCKLTNIDVSNFNTSNVTNMWYMFEGCKNLTQLDLSNFDTSNVTNMSFMFANCNNLTQIDLSSFNTNNVTKMYGMFSGCSNLIQLDLSNFNTSNVLGMDYLFKGCSTLTSLDLSSFDTSKVENSIGWMFKECDNLTEISFGGNWTREITLPTLVKEGHTCTGWYSDRNFTNKVVNVIEMVVSTYTPTGNVTIYAELKMR